MSELFLSVLNMSLTASYVIIFVILARLLLKKAPKVISYALWGVVAFRLIIPFSFESIFSLMPLNTNAVPILHDIIYQQSPQINSGIEVVDSFVSQLPAPTVGASVNPLQIYIEIGAYIWISGIVVLLIYSIVSVLQLKRQLKSALLIEQNIFEVNNLKTPFVLGLIRPNIYLPVGLKATERNYILLHEQTHIHRKDHIIKVLAFLILSIHWFNPLVWIAFRLMSTDMELSCDERVLKEMDEDVKKPYANSLLSLATGRHILNGSPLAFSEGNVRGRIKNVLNFKKSTAWIIVVSVALVAILSVGLASNRANDGTGDYDFYNFNVNGFMLGADIKEMDTSILTPTEPLNVKDGYDFNFEEVRYSANEENGRLKKMIVNVYDNGVMSMLVTHANGRDNVSLDSNETYQIEGIEAILGKGKTGWHDREQRLRYMEYRHKEGRLSATIRFVYTDGVDVFTHRLVWVIAESSLPYPYPYTNGGSAEKLWEARSKYIGDNSAVGKLIGLLPAPKDVKYDHFELHTSEQPYDIEIIYSASSEVLKLYDTEEAVKSNTFRKNALILLALVDNVDGVRATLTDGKREVGFINAREWADYTVGEDVRNYAESPEKLQELIEMPLTVTAPNEDIIIDIGQSTKFTEEEIGNAIKIVKENFAFPASTLTKIWYNEEESNRLTKIYLENGRGSVNGANLENGIVLLTNFDVDDSGDNPVLNLGSTYVDYQWILIRDDKTSKWNIDDFGY